MKWLVLVALVLVAGCMWTLPTPEQAATLKEITVARVADNAAYKAGTLSLEEYVQREAARVVQENAIRKAGTPLWSIVLNGILGVTLIAFGGQRNLYAAIANLICKLLGLKQAVPPPA